METLYFGDFCRLQMLQKLETTFLALFPKKGVFTSKNKYTFYKQLVAQVCPLGSPNCTHQLYRFLFFSESIKSFFKHSLDPAKNWKSLVYLSFGRTIARYRTIGIIWSLVWWTIPVITVFGKLREKDNHEFKASLGYWWKSVKKSDKFHIQVWREYSLVYTGLNEADYQRIWNAQSSVSAIKYPFRPHFETKIHDSVSPSSDFSNILWLCIT